MEYKEEQLTDWICGVPPLRDGVYNTSSGYFAYWSESKGWGLGCRHANSAESFKDDGFDPLFYHTEHGWRGLSSDPSPKPKKAGNRKVTRYVVMAGFYDRSMEAVAVFSDKKLAQERESLAKKQYGVTDTGIQKIRFRTSEA